MRLTDTKPFGCKLIIVTNQQGKEYVLQGYIVDGYYLIPFVPHWNSNDTIVNPLYWEPHYAKRNTWIPIDEVNFDEWDITQNEFELIKSEGDKAYKEILEKYHASF